MDSGGKTISITHGGVNSGLLLANGGTVCDDSFDNNSAAAICREMGFSVEGVSWTFGNKWGIQKSYLIKLDQVECSSTYWSSCSYDTNHDCYHSEDVHLTCGQPPGIDII